MHLRRAARACTAACVALVVVFAAAKAAGFYLHGDTTAYVKWTPSGTTMAIVLVVRAQRV